MSDISFNKDEKRIISQISLILAIRQLGVSMIIPFLSIYTMSMIDSTKTLAGLAFGIFGVSQTIVQIPIGKLSDKWGRKQTTILGLTIFCIGTILSGFSYNIFQLIFARLLTGAGAVRGVIMAWLTDGIHKSKRNSALSFVGIAIGAGVTIGFIVNSIIAGKIGMHYLFYICAGLIFIVIIYTSFCLNNFHDRDAYNIDFKKKDIAIILKNHDLLRINLLGFIESLCFASTFFILPILINEKMDIISMVKINAPMGIIGTCFMFFFARRADKNGLIGTVPIALLFAFIGTIIPIIFNNIFSFAASIIMIYSAHCIMAPLLPAAVSKYPNTQLKGTAMGVFITFQAIGSSLGGLISGKMLEDFDYRYSFVLLTISFVIALIITIGYKDFKGKK